MVETNCLGEDDTIILARPNQSASWRTNQLLIAAITMVSMIIALGFASIGAWIILPFAGLELAALSSSLYYVSWKLNYRHIIRAHNNQLIVEKGYYYPKQTWRLDKNAVSILVNDNDRHQALSISLCDRKETIAIGSFLNRNDSNALLHNLKKLGLPVNGYSKLGSIQL